MSDISSETISEKQVTWIINNSKYFDELHTGKSKLCRQVNEKVSSGNYSLDGPETGILFEMVQFQITDLKFKIQWYEKQTDERFKLYLDGARVTLEMLTDLREKVMKKNKEVTKTPLPPVGDKPGKPDPVKKDPLPPVGSKPTPPVPVKKTPLPPVGDKPAQPIKK